MENKDNMQGQLDIFDRLMVLPILKILEPYYKKHKEGVLYLFFGGMSFLISILTYGALSGIFCIDVLVSNIFAWIFTVSFAYAANRAWVFEVKAAGASAIVKEISRFVSGRAATLIVEEVILLIFVDWMELGSMEVKIAATVLVIILNYVISKFWVFGLEK